MLNTAITRYSSLAFILLLLQEDPLLAQRNWYLNTGIKLGYAFGDRGGFISGIEVSATTWPESAHIFTGVCVSIEQVKSLVVAHIGFETGSIVAVSVGPSLLVSNQGNQFALTTTVFGGLLIIPYFRYNYVPNASDIPEVGSFLKIPVKLSGSMKFVGS